MYAYRNAREKFWLMVASGALITTLLFFPAYNFSLKPNKGNWPYVALITVVAFLFFCVYLLVDLIKTSRRIKSVTYKREIGYINKALKDVLILNGNYNRKDIQLKTLLSTILHSLNAGLTEKQINEYLNDKGSDLHFEETSMIKYKKIGTHVLLKKGTIEVVSMKIY